MARVKITLTCSCCGKKFEHIHDCRNSSEASSYTEWAKENVTTCPDCHYAEKKAKERVDLDRYLASFGEAHKLPEITGVSEKQIAFAEKLRSDFISKELMRYKIDLARFFRLSDMICFENLDQASLMKVKALAANAGEAPEQWFARYRTEKIAHDAGRLDKSLVKKIEVIFSESGASKIIDALR